MISQMRLSIVSCSYCGLRKLLVYLRMKLSWNVKNIDMIVEECLTFFASRQTTAVTTSKCIDSHHNEFKIEHRLRAALAKNLKVLMIKSNT